MSRQFAGSEFTRAEQVAVTCLMVAAGIAVAIGCFYVQHGMTLTEAARYALTVWELTFGTVVLAIAVAIGIMTQRLWLWVGGIAYVWFSAVLYFKVGPFAAQALHGYTVAIAVATAVIWLDSRRDRSELID